MLHGSKYIVGRIHESYSSLTANRPGISNGATASFAALEIGYFSTHVYRFQDFSAGFGVGFQLNRTKVVPGSFARIGWT